MKSIRTAILICIALFALSSCDAVLEVFYPEFAASKDGENVVSVRADFYIYETEITGSNPYIAGMVRDLNSSKEIKAYSEPSWYWNEDKSGTYWHIEGNIDFRDVPDGEYDVLIWFEQNGDREPGGENEPSKLAMRSDDGSTIFTFPSSASSGGWLYGEVEFPLR